jgi:hypothetical protein
MRRFAPLALVLPLGACPYVDSGELRVVRGAAAPLTPGDAVELALYCDGLWDGPELTAGDGRCGHDWRVDDVTGGNAEIGTISSCGVYTAPAAPPAAGSVEVGASECAWGSTCFDVCGATLQIDLAAP